MTHPFAKPERNREIVRRAIAGEKYLSLAFAFKVASDRIYRIVSKSMKHYCPKCKELIAKEDRRRKVAPIKAVPPAVLSYGKDSAPRIKCYKCGHATVLLKGSL